MRNIEMNWSRIRFYLCIYHAQMHKFIFIPLSFDLSKLNFTFSIVMDIDGHISSWQHCAHYTRWQHDFTVPKTILYDLISLEGWSLVTSHHATWSCLLSVGNALSTAFFILFSWITLPTALWFWGKKIQVSAKLGITNNMKIIYKLLCMDKICKKKKLDFTIIFKYWCIFCVRNPHKT